jgi:hypothetical protein
MKKRMTLMVTVIGAVVAALMILLGGHVVHLVKELHGQ